tara:strand:+ start:886 stop:1332 length:447 start_codon:yes stop_codon:yes gene_type:complete
MIQLDYKSSGTKTLVFFTETETSASTGVITVTNDITGVETDIPGNITSNKVLADFGGWIALGITSSTIPTESGQYSANIYETGELQLTWGTAFKAWTNVKSEWINYVTESNAKINLLNEDRALVSGSDYDVISTYSNEDIANFNVYNG